MTEAIKKNWRDVGMEYFHPRVISMLFLGFSAGVPILLIFSSLSLWLREAGIDRSTATMFSWAALGYSFKFVWAPLVDRLPVPILTRLLGRRRAWMLVSQISIILAILWMSITDPSTKSEFVLVIMAMATILLGFSSATQDIVIDAYRIEAADKNSQAVISSTYIAGYRIGMIVAGAGALFLASYWGSTKDHYEYTAWLWTYQAMALVMLVGIITTIIIPEPEKFRSMSKRLSIGYLLVVITLLFAGNEFAAAMVTPENPYYLAFIWFVRALYVTTIFFIIKKFLSLKQSSQDGLFEHSSLNIVAFIILGVTFLSWLISYYITVTSQGAIELESSPVAAIPVHLLWLAVIFLSIIFIAIYIRQRVDALAKEKEAPKYHHTTTDYLGFLALFAAAVLGFIFVYMLTSKLPLKLASLDLYNNSAIFHSVVNTLMSIPEGIASIKTILTDYFGNKKLSSLLIETVRLLMAVSIATLIGRLLSKTKMVNSEMVRSTYVAPLEDFFSRYGVGIAILLLSLIGLYRISDIVLGVIANIFYQDLGYTKDQIASIVKTFGLFMTIAGGFLGGILALRYGVMKILFVGALFSAATNLLFVLMARLGTADPSMLYLVISADNLTAGLASAAFIAFLSSLTNIKFTAVQYAIFSSLMTLLPKVIGGYSGSIVESFCKADQIATNHCMVGYENFFLITTVIGIPVLVLIWLANKHLNIAEFSLKN